MTEFVFDASALLAVFFREPGQEVAEPLMHGAAISAVNLSEVVKKVVDKGGLTDSVLAAVHGQAMQIVPFDVQDATRAGELYLATRAAGLSFADRACVSLGIHRRRTVVTAERRMAKLNLDVEVRLIRHVA